jgi:putative membrane protein
VIGPRAVPPGQPIVTGRQIFFFVCTMLMLWGASDWPMHDIGETYLYSAHMLQHMMLAYFLPPLAILATPEWLLRLLIGNGRTYRVFRFMTKPVVAAVLFNATVMITHIPGVVNASGADAVLHYSLHTLLVVTALLMWMPVIGPFKELQMGYGGKMVYLFAQSIIPTVPAGWLTFADGVVYKRYNIPVRVWGIGVITDQQTAGAIMKLGGTIFLWSIIIFIYFRRFSVGVEEANSYRRIRLREPDAPPPPSPDTLTYEQITEVFDRTPAIHESERSK